MIPTPSERHELYLKTYDSKTEAEIVEAYRRWAPCYEYHILDQGWRAPELCAALLAAHLPRRDGRILDIGAGTGLVGRALRRLGFMRLEALDLSVDMLEQARDKGVYDEIHVGNAETMTGFEDGAFNASICVGSLNFGHIPAEAYGEFIRVTKPDGLIAFTTREDFYRAGSRDEQERLAREKRWRLVETRVVANAVKDTPHRHWCYAVC